MNISRKTLLLFIPCVLFLVPVAASAALTEPQVSAIIGLLQSFGADASVIANVEASLSGNAPVAPAINMSSSCPFFSYNLYFGTTDATTNGEVSKLQSFLGSSVSGYFGAQTEAAVQNWQSSHGVVSSGTPNTTGYGAAGPQTRAAMRAACSAGLSSIAAPASNQTVPSGTNTIPTAIATNSAAAATSTAPVSNTTVVTNGPASTLSGPQNFILGINLPVLDQPSAALLSKSGAAVRIGFYWSLMEPKKGQWVFGLNDSQVQLAKTKNIPILGTLATAPSWAILQDPSCTSRFWGTCQPQEQSMNDYLNYVATVVARYPYVKYWEVWNEENYEYFWHNPDPAVYVALLKQVYPVIKKANPDATVVLGGLGFLDPTSDSTYLKSIYADGAKNYFDVMNFHPYRQPKGPDENYDYSNLNGQTGVTLSQEIASVKGIMDQNGDGAKKIWITEIGWQTAGDARAVSYAKQAQYVQQTYKDVRAIPYVGALFFYKLMDSCTDTSDFECWVGLVSQSGVPKPAFTVFNSLLSSSTAALPAAPVADPNPTPVPPPTPLAPPANISYACSSDGTAVTFSWPLSEGATTYVPFIKNVASCPTGWVADSTVPGTCYKDSVSGNAITFSGITPGVSYIGWVHAKNSAGVNWNASASTTWFSCAKPVPPPPPTKISYACGVGGTSVTFSWPSVSGATAYWPFIKTVSSCPAGWTADPGVPGTCYENGIPGTTATFNSIAPGASYIGWVHAGNGAGVNWNVMAHTDWFSCAAS